VLSSNEETYDIGKGLFHSAGSRFEFEACSRMTVATPFDPILQHGVSLGYFVTAVSPRNRLSCVHLVNFFLCLLRHCFVLIEANLAMRLTPDVYASSHVGRRCAT
jgi:hypothetical protein